MCQKNTSICLKMNYAKYHLGLPIIIQKYLLNSFGTTSQLPLSTLALSKTNFLTQRKIEMYDIVIWCSKLLTYLLIIGVFVLTFLGENPGSL